MDTSKDNAMLQHAVRLACESAKSGGGPFGAVVARDGVVLGEGANRVTLDRDPTAHAEVIALRAACAASASHTLSGAVLYTSCEPCPMCLAAAWWARVSRIVFCATRTHAAAAGFDDERLYEELRLPLGERALPLQGALPELSDQAFSLWRQNASRIPY